MSRLSVTSVKQLYFYLLFIKLILLKTSDLKGRLNFEKCFEPLPVMILPMWALSLNSGVWQEQGRLAKSRLSVTSVKQLYFYLLFIKLILLKTSDLKGRLNFEKCFEPLPVMILPMWALSLNSGVWQEQGRLAKSRLSVTSVKQLYFYLLFIKLILLKTSDLIKR